MGDCALRFLSESLSVGIGLPLCLTPRVRCEDWEKSRHWQQCEYLFSLAPGRGRPCLDRRRCRDSQSGTSHNRIECLRRPTIVPVYRKPRYVAGRFQAQGCAYPIRTESWIAIGSLILPGVTIGEGAVVSAGSVVLKDVPANCLVRGNPATVVHEISRGPECAKAYRVSRVCDKSLSPSPDPAAVVDGSPHITKDGR